MSAVWVECPKCGAKRDASNRFTSPANAEKDAREWEALHRDGKCLEAAALERKMERAALVARHRAVDGEIAALRDEQRELVRKVRALDVQRRPAVYPTDAQREGIKVAAQRIRDKVPSKSHHGDPCGPAVDGEDADRRSGQYSVTVETQRGRINMYAGAPLEWEGGGARQWHFSEGDVAALRDLVLAEGLTIFSEWRHDDGFAVIVGFAD